MKLTELTPGQAAVIEDFTNPLLALKFMEMGIVQGAQVSLYARAAFRGPLAIEVSGSRISMRKTEAETISIRLV